MKNIVLLALIILPILIGCRENSKIDGLWLVKSVTVGEEEMTPNARWMRFNSDSTQESGNGWFQHSIGTWALSQNKLKMINTNGLTDPYEAFEISYSEHVMTWKRKEDDQPVSVTLERLENLPSTYGDQLLGLWKLEKAVGTGDIFNQTENSNDYLFFRWDKRFVVGTDSGRYSGTYQVNGHRPQVTLIPNDEKITRSNWEIKFNQNQIILKRLNIDSIVTRKFDRINDFPE